jgi:Uma2 family endonuclease
MMTPVKTELSWEEFEQLPDDGTHNELFEGELIALAPPKSTHSEIAYTVSWALAPYVRKKRLGRVYVEAGYRIFCDDRFWIQPDVSFLRQERLKKTTKDGYFDGPPDLAIEVESPSETKRDLMRKAHACLAAGSAAVWIIHPKKREVQVLLASGESSVLTESDTISLPELFPGWKTKVATFFKD